MLKKGNINGVIEKLTGIELKPYMYKRKKQTKNFSLSGQYIKGSPLICNSTLTAPDLDSYNNLLSNLEANNIYLEQDFIDKLKIDSESIKMLKVKK